jgi:hypothetical protein
MALKHIHSDPHDVIPELCMMASAALIGSGAITFMMNSSFLGTCLLAGGIAFGVVSGFLINKPTIIRVIRTGQRK